MRNVFGMDIRRFSVLVVATVILISLVGSFVNVKVPQPTNTTIQLGNSVGGGSSNNNLPTTGYTPYKTIVATPSLSDLQYVHASYLPTPYTSSTLFNLSRPEGDVFHLLLNALSWNASEVAPGSYGDLLSVASSGYVTPVNYTNTTLFTLPLNQNDTENYAKTELLVKYVDGFKTPTYFQPGWSYPPSDVVYVNPLVYKTIKTFSVPTNVRLSINSSHLYVAYINTIRIGGVVITCQYDALNVQGTAYLYSNGTLLASQPFSATFSSCGGLYKNQIDGYVTVPPGVSKMVFDYYYLYAVSRSCGYGGNGFSFVLFYPQLSHTWSTSYTFNWYQYNVSFPLSVTVLNGSNPVTYIDSKGYQTQSVYAVPWYTTWSSEPITNITTITTQDHIQVLNYTVERMWDAGSVEVIPELYTPPPNNCVVNYFLNFTVKTNLATPPPWVSQPMLYNENAVVSWFYLLRNASVSHALYDYVMNTVNKTDVQYWRFEYLTLVSQFAMNTTDPLVNLLELGSFYENWSTVNAQILNVTVWSKSQYFPGTLIFFNVTKVPLIYNDSTFFNVSNDEVYLVDVYNKWGEIPFGNPYSYQGVDFYLVNDQPVPRLNEVLYFHDAVYTQVPFVILGVGTPTTITAIWNGTTR